MYVHDHEWVTTVMLATLCTAGADVCRKYACLLAGSMLHVSRQIGNDHCFMHLDMPALSLVHVLYHLDFLSYQ